MVRLTSSCRADYCQDIFKTLYRLSEKIRKSIDLFFRLYENDQENINVTLITNRKFIAATRSLIKAPDRRGQNRVLVTEKCRQSLRGWNKLLKYGKSYSRIVIDIRQDKFLVFENRLEIYSFHLKITCMNIY